ncbi:ATP-dependent DNA ligase [Neorhodopirellula pilleata]|uniref:DNA ligase (ATP) n=1 Tax=Neorhodopirellula pilleata TaxID=2714738 RepID=A0A5C5ZW43_9BACT|nr:ATP-dependent DNA ligase [Neorhodopirellula pilleata]TWT91370.1 ATP-dependent DNA ligase [Neorhodopirellula pilleata]
MKRFVQLFESLDQTTKTNEKIAAIAGYFSTVLNDAQSSRADAAWAAHYLSGRRAKRLVRTGTLRRLAAEAADIPDWLFDESYDAVGDLAETISLLVPPSDIEQRETGERSLTTWIENFVLPLAKMEETEQQLLVGEIWQQTDGTSRLILMKLITGSFRLGVSARLVARGIAQATGLPPDVIAHRLMGHWKASADFVDRLVDPDTDDAVLSRPYPFCLAHALQGDNGEGEESEFKHEMLAPVVSGLGGVSDYIAEWKWDGIRGQVIRRSGQTFVWSRGEELMQGRWPEVERAAEFLPDGTVLDGEILASRFDGDRIEVLPFAELQRRIGRKTVGKKLLAEVPVMFHAFDCLEYDGVDVREQPLSKRRDYLLALVEQHQPPGLHLNPAIPVRSWSDVADVRSTSRDQNAEGVMLKRLDATYSVGRVRGVWWKWKLAPYTVDAVLIYAQRGHGKRASLYTDYTFAVWNGGELVPFAKAYSGLTDAEIRIVDRFVRENTSQRFGPVRSVKPELVMELAFEGLQRSTRHKSGIATRFPRIVRIRKDKTPADADKLEDLVAMLESTAP